MLDKQEKKTVGLAVLLIVALSVVSLIFRAEKPDQTDYKLAQDEIITEDGFVTNVKASEQIINQAIEEDELDKDIAERFKMDQTVKVSLVPNSTLLIDGNNSLEALGRYLTNTRDLVAEYEDDSKPLEKLFVIGTDTNELDKAKKLNDRVLEDLYDTLVPSDAVEYHKAAIQGLKANNKVIEYARTYLNDPTRDIWPDVYYQYKVINYTNLRMKFEAEKIKS